MKLSKNHNGFTLVELLVVIVIIAMLLAFVIPNFGDARKQSRDAQRKADIESIRTALELYKADNDYYPTGCAGSLNGCIADNLQPDYITVLPTDPSGTYYYRYYTSGCTTDNCTSYYLGSFLESEPNTCPVSLACGVSGNSCFHCTRNP